MKNNLLSILILSLLVCSCSKDDTPQLQLSEDAKYYMDFAFNLMEVNSIRKYEIEWESFREKYFKLAEDAQNYEDTYSTLNRALQELHNHSFFWTPKNYSNSQSKDDSEIEWPEAFVDQEIGFLELPGFSGTQEQAVKYATMLQDSIKAFEQRNIQAWVVDLRNDIGGNMYPMIAGLGPLFDTITLGYFIMPDEYETPWSYNNGSSMISTTTLCNVINPYTLQDNTRKIAVLQDTKTASSEEATLISFIGNKNTKRFGAPSAGYSTANVSYKMPDNARLILTTSYMADRNKNIYGEKVSPDVNCSADETHIKALEWIFEK